MSKRLDQDALPDDGMEDVQTVDIPVSAPDSPHGSEEPPPASDDLRAQIVQLEAERDGYRAAYQNIASEFGGMRSDRDGYRNAYQEMAELVGGLRSDVEGYRSAYEKIASEIGSLRAERDNERAARIEMESRIGAIQTERDGYKDAYEKIASEVGSLRAERDNERASRIEVEARLGVIQTERDGYKAAYEQVSSSSGSLRTDVDGYKAAYEQINAEIGSLRAELEEDRKTLEALERQVTFLESERDELRDAHRLLLEEIGTLRSERDGYKGAYEQVETQKAQLWNQLEARTADAAAARNDLERLQGDAALKAQAIQRETRNAGLLAHIPELLPTLGSVFGDHKPGPNRNALILNSVPKAGTYLLLETVKCFGEFTDTEYHAYADSMRRLGEGGRFDNERNIPALLWSAALQPGTMCVSHVEYDPIVEQYFCSRPDLKTIFIIRDPRDLVVSWVDFVYSSSSYPRMAGWNAYERKMTELHPTSDEQRLFGSIEGLLRSGIASYTAWIDSPSCLTVKFEDLYAALSGTGPAAGETVLDRIADHLELPRRSAAEFQASLGKGLTSSGRQDKIGVYKRRMNEAHIERLKKPDFQKVVIDFGYEPT